MTKVSSLRLMLALAALPLTLPAAPAERTSPPSSTSEPSPVRPVGRARKAPDAVLVERLVAALRESRRESYPLFAADSVGMISGPGRTRGRVHVGGKADSPAGADLRLDGPATALPLVAAVAAHGAH